MIVLVSLIVLLRTLLFFRMVHPYNTVHCILALPLTWRVLASKPGLLPPFSIYAFNCRRAQLRTELEEGEGLVSRLARTSFAQKVQSRIQAVVRRKHTCQSPI